MNEQPPIFLRIPLFYPLKPPSTCFSNIERHLITMERDPKLERNCVPMILKTFEVLERFREKPEGLTYTDLIDRNPDIPKISIYRILCSLEYLGYLQKDPHSNKFELGAKFIELGRITEKQQDIVRITRPYMEKLCQEYGENVNLVKLEGAEFVRLNLIEGSHPLRVMEYTSRSDDVYSSATTKTILALYSEEDKRQVVESLQFKQLTPHTISSKRAFYEELTKVAQIGYAVDDEENLLGVRCVSAPLRDHNGYPLAAISVTGPSFRITPERIPEIGRHLIGVTNEISEKFFGFNSRS